MASVAGKSVDAYLADLPAIQQVLVEALRRLVLDAAPSARESMKWSQAVFEDHGPFAYIQAHKAHVTLGFWRGVELDHGRGILKSGGSSMAHLRVTNLAEIDPGLLQTLVKKAVRLNRSTGDPTRRGRGT